MSEVFYRKWRPQKLADVVGQDSVIQTLRQAVALGRVAHAYLFCGPRGTGKTSTARILAKAVNCLSPQDGEPDNECEICLSITEGRALDLIEIDAASNRGIDDIRDLSDKIRFSPNEARYKFYIIDEVHMLTTQAFNALLKTLEEPPEHAIFVLATTEPSDVPLTIVSRCQRFDFRRISPESMVGKLSELCRGEDVEASPESLDLIARTSTGSLRDAENLLEQVVVSYGSPVTEEQVRDLLGLGGDELAEELVGHIVGRSVDQGLMVINRVSSQGDDLRQLHRGIMDYLRGLLLLKTNAGSSLNFTSETETRLKSLAGTASIEFIVRALKTFAKVDLRHDSASPLPLELALVEATTDIPAAVASPSAPSVVEQARPARRAPVPVAAKREPARSSAPVPAKTTETAPDPAAEPDDPKPDVEAMPAVIPSEPAARLEGQWGEFVRSLRHTGKKFKLGALLRGCSEREVADGVIIIKFPYVSHVERMQGELEDPHVRGQVKEVLSQLMDDPYEIQVSLAKAENNSPRQNVAQRSHLVRAAQAMGARIIDEKEENHDE